LLESIQNFSMLRGSDKFGREARIGYTAAIVRYMERANGCISKYQFLVHVMAEVKSWPLSKDHIEHTADFVEVVLQGNAYRSAATYLLPTNRCSAILQGFFANSSFEEFAERADQSYRMALALLSSSKDWEEDLKRRYSLSVRAQQKYLLNDRTDFSIIRKTGRIDLAEAALKAGLDLAREKGALPETQRRVFAPFLSGSNAESYLRLATLHRDQPNVQAQLIDKAVDQLRMTVSTGNEQAANWAMLRLADIEFSRNRIREALEWFKSYFASRGTGGKSFFDAMDERAFGSDILIEKGPSACSAIELVRKGGIADGSSFIAMLFLVDSYRRVGNLEAASVLMKDVQAKLSTATQWIGENIPVKSDLVRAKLDALSGNKETGADMLKSRLQELIKEPNHLTLLFDAYEIAGLVGDDHSLTLAEVVLKKSVPFVGELLGRQNGADCH
jgi:hypothetical protein